MSSEGSAAIVCGEFVDERGIDERFVALDVDDVGGLRHGAQGLGDAVGAGRVVRRGHHRLAAEAVDGVQMRSSSVATRISSSLEHCWQRSQTCWIRGFPAMRWSGLPGKRVEPQRAGRTPRIWILGDGMRHACKRLGERRTRTCRRTRAVSEKSSPDGQQRSSASAAGFRDSEFRIPSGRIPIRQ